MAQRGGRFQNRWGCNGSILNITWQPGGVGWGRNTRKKDISLCWRIGFEEVYKRLLDADLAEHISPSNPTASALKNVSTSEIHHEHQSIVPLFWSCVSSSPRDGREVPGFSSGQKEDNEGSVAHKARFEEEEVVVVPLPVPIMVDILLNQVFSIIPMAATGPPEPIKRLTWEPKQI
ncbi:hypothetical protein CEXT_459011 [Caerostris extrusa]|uniref:Uncharacterized protein n=1 Tax=Caerostris extrusa TaxID=172846 RepID=A0AAV4MGP1_CAEEX|nr:hypothetical protein CEXT_459011 [Caerostris extrusa]